MKPFTEYYRLLAFCYQAEGDFSYLWYELRFTELIRIQGVKRVFLCTSLEMK